MICLRLTLLVASCSFLLLTSIANAVEVGPQYEFQGLGLSPFGGTWSATAISEVGQGDELVVVGNAGLNALRWTESDGPETILAGGRFFAQAQDVSGDGNIVVGTDFEGWRWTVENGVEELGLLPGGQNFSNAWGITRDGKTIVGNSQTSTVGQAARWENESDGSFSGPVGLEIPGQVMTGVAGNNFSALDAIRVGQGETSTLWSVGQSNQLGGGNFGIVWRDDAFFHGFQDPANGDTIAVAVGVEDGNPVIPLITSINAFAQGFVVARFVEGEFILETVTNPGGTSSTSGHFPTDISTDGSVIAGWDTLPDASSEALIWERDSVIWGRTAGNNACSEGEICGESVKALLQERLLPTAQADVGLGDWVLTRAEGVTTHTEFVPLLGANLVTSVVVGNGTNPDGVSVPWTATVHHAPGLVTEDLPTRDLFSGGDFVGDGSEWSEVGAGAFEIVSTLSGDGTAARLTSDTEFSIEQLVNTPDSPFVIVLDQLFTTDVGRLQIFLDGVLLEEITAPTSIGNEFKTLPILVADPDLLGQQNVELSITVLGGSTGQVLIDNVAIASVPEPNSLVLSTMLILCISAWRRSR